MGVSGMELPMVQGTAQCAGKPPEPICGPKHHLPGNVPQWLHSSVDRKRQVFLRAVISSSIMGFFQSR